MNNKMTTPAIEYIDTWIHNRVMNGSIKEGTAKTYRSLLNQMKLGLGSDDVPIDELLSKGKEKRTHHLRLLTHHMLSLIGSLKNRETFNKIIRLFLYRIDMEHGSDGSWYKELVKGNPIEYLCPNHKIIVGGKQPRSKRKGSKNKNVIIVKTWKIIIKNKEGGGDPIIMDNFYTWVMELMIHV